MSTKKSTKQENIEAKQKFVKDNCSNEEMKNELNYQIEVCEYLGCPISETQIKEWITLTVNSMLSKVHNHKFA